MATKRTKAAPTDDLDELFEGIGDDTAPKKAGKPKASASAAAAAKPKADPEQDILAELENQLEEKQPSRPHTPRIKDVAAKGSPAARVSDDKSSGLARKSAESTRSFHATSFTPSATSSDLPESEKRGAAEPTQAASAGSGWWGGFIATASAAVKQAEAAVKEIQQNEEAKKWVQGVQGNVNVLRGYGRFSS